MTLVGADWPLEDYCPYDLEPDPSALSCEERYVETALGRLHVVERPSSSLRTTLLLHGVGGTWRSWTAFVQAADAGGLDLGRVVLVDLPGFGESTNSTGHLRTEDISRTLRELVADEREGAQLVLLGQSMGGYLALEMAALTPEGITLVCVVSATFFRIFDAFRAPWKLLRTQRRLAVGAGAIRLLAALPRSEQLIGRLLRNVKTNNALGSVATHPDLLKPRMRASLGAPLAPANLVMAADNAKRRDPRESWPAISVPLVCVFGEHDGIVNADDRRTAAAVLPQATHYVFADAGHVGHVEWSTKLLDLLAQALPSAD